MVRYGKYQPESRERPPEMAAVAGPDAERPGARKGTGSSR
jgi:hypothetical protein